MRLSRLRSTRIVSPPWSKLRDYLVDGDMRLVTSTTQKVMSMVVLQLPAPRVPLTDVEFWRKKIQRVNAEHLNSVLGKTSATTNRA